MEVWREVMLVGWDAVPAPVWINIQACAERYAGARWEEALREHLADWRQEGGSCFPPDFLQALPARLAPARFGLPATGSAVVQEPVLPVLEGALTPFWRPEQASGKR